MRQCRARMNAKKKNLTYFYINNKKYILLFNFRFFNIKNNIVI